MTVTSPSSKIMDWPERTGRSIKQRGWRRRGRGLRGMLGLGCCLRIAGNGDGLIGPLVAASVPVLG